VHRTLVMLVSSAVERLRRAGLLWVRRFCCFLICLAVAGVATGGLAWAQSGGQPDSDNQPSKKSSDDSDDAKASPFDKPDKEGADNKMPADAEGEESGEANLEVTGKKPPEFSIVRPLTTDKDWKEWNKKGRRDYRDAIASGDLTTQNVRIIGDGIRAQIYALTLGSFNDPHVVEDQRSRIVQTLITDIKNAAGNKDIAVQRAVRSTMFREMINRCREIGDNQFYARLDAAVLLGRMFVVDPDPLKQSPGEFYQPATDALLDVLTRKGQPEAIKILAVRGLENAALYSVPRLTPEKNVKVATALIQELAKPNTNPWYQSCLCEALGSIDEFNDFNGQPFIVQALTMALFDHNRNLCARSAAAKALGRAKIESPIDLGVVAYGIADLSRQMIEARNEGKHVRRWCIANILLAFKPGTLERDRRGVGLLDRVEEPMLQKYRKPVQDLSKAFYPVVVQELKQPSAPFPEKVSVPIVEWMKANKPRELRIAPSLPQIATPETITNAEGGDPKKPDSSP
jgi:hypothetical protein